jgi:integrase
MAIYRKRINGRKVWWVRVNYRGLNASRVCENKETAKDAETELRGKLRRQVEYTEQQGVAPATLSRVFRKAARGAGLKDFHFHDLRHHGATMALNAGFTVPIVMQLGGWKTEKMMRRYAAVTDTTLRAAAEAVIGNAEWKWGAKSAPALAAPMPSQG